MKRKHNSCLNRDLGRLDDLQDLLNNEDTKTISSQDLVLLCSLGVFVVHLISYLELIIIHR